MKKYRIKKFTLIELLAAMAVFSIMLMISMRLFSGAQSLWLRSEQKTATFANARVAMEFIASRVQSCVYNEYYPFCISNNTDHDKFLFVSRMPLGNSMSNRLTSRRFFQFYLVDPTDTTNSDAGTLQLRVYSGREGTDSEKFRWIFPPYNDDNRYFKYPGDAFNHVANALNDNETDKDTVVDIVENVISFNLVCYNSVLNGSSWSLIKHDYASDGNNLKTPPYLIEVEIMMLDGEESFKRWQGFKDADGDSEEKKVLNKKNRDEIFSEFGYTFRRAILLGEE